MCSNARIVALFGGRIAKTEASSREVLKMTWQGWQYQLFTTCDRTYLAVREAERKFTLPLRLQFGFQRTSDV